MTSTMLRTPISYKKRQLCLAPRRRAPFDWSIRGPRSMRKYRTDFISSDGNVEVHYVLLREQFHCQQQTYNRVKLYTNETLHLGGGSARRGYQCLALRCNWGNC